MNHGEAHDLLYGWLEGVSIMRHEADRHPGNCCGSLMDCESGYGIRWRQGKKQVDRLEKRILQALTGDEVPS